MTIDELRKHVQTFFSDTSRSPAQTKEDLLNLVDEIEMMAESIDTGE